MRNQSSQRKPRQNHTHTSHVFMGLVLSELQVISHISVVGVTVWEEAYTQALMSGSNCSAVTGTAVW